MSRTARRRLPAPVLVTAALVAFTLMPVAWARQAQPPTRPLAPEKYQAIQVLKDVPADQVSPTMIYFSSALGVGCQNCHVPGKPGEDLNFAADTPNKTTARGMIRLVQAINAGDYGAKVTCTTCHAGKSRPAGLQLMTPDRFAAILKEAAEGRQGAPGPPGQPALPAGPAGSPAVEPAAPSVEFVINKYIDAVGGREALDHMPPWVISATRGNPGSPQALPVTIEQHGAKMRLSIQAAIVGFDGVSGWATVGGKTTDVEGFALHQLLRLVNLLPSPQLKDKYATLTAARPQSLPPVAPGGAAIDVNVLNASPWPDVVERLYFDAASGLLLRSVVTTSVALGGVLQEQYDYSDYRLVAGVKVAHLVTHTNFGAIDTMIVTDIKGSPATDDTRFAKPKGPGSTR